MYRDDLEAAHARIRILENRTTQERAVERLIETLLAERAHFVNERDRRRRWSNGAMLLLAPVVLTPFLRMLVEHHGSITPWFVVGVLATLLLGVFTLHYVMRVRRVNQTYWVAEADAKIRDIDVRIAELRIFAAIGNGPNGSLRIANQEDAEAVEVATPEEEGGPRVGRRLGV